MLDLESQGPGSIPTGGKYHFLFYNPNLHNIARYGRIRFKMKNPTDSKTDRQTHSHGEPISHSLHKMLKLPRCSRCASHNWKDFHQFISFSQKSPWILFV